HHIALPPFPTRRSSDLLGVPERVAVVARAGETLGADRPALGSGARLEHLEEVEAHGLLQLGISLDLDVSAVPEVVEELPLLLERSEEHTSELQSPDHLV